MKWCAAFLCTIACSATAQEKATFIIDVVGGPVSPSNPTVTVKLFAVFPSQYWAFGETNISLNSTDPSGEFKNISKPVGIGALSASGVCAPWLGGTPNGLGGVDGIHPFQFNAVGCSASTWNPIQFWQGEWTTTDFSPREVELSSANVLFFTVYTSSNHSFPDLNLYPSSFENSSTTFQVIPAPGLPVVLGAIIPTVFRRRR